MKTLGSLLTEIDSHTKSEQTFIAFLLCKAPGWGGGLSGARRLITRKEEVYEDLSADELGTYAYLVHQYINPFAKKHDLPTIELSRQLFVDLFKRQGKRPLSPRIEKLMKQYRGSMSDALAE